MFDKSIQFGKEFALSLANLAITAVIAFLLVFLLSKVIHHLFQKYSSNKLAINVRYTENMLRVLLILVAFFWVVSNSSATASLGKILFQGTALIGAVAGFAAQPILSDLFCGLMISAQKPFELGDRIELEDGTSGIVKDITIRHIVLRGMDTTDLVIPNSRINAMRVINMSHGGTKRSFIFSVNIAYDSDIRAAMEAVGEAIKSCPYTVPGKPGESGSVYAPVYFIAYDTSSLVLRTTVYFEPKNGTEAVMSQVNLAVREALYDRGIEIPYSYLNVVMKEKRKSDEI